MGAHVLYSQPPLDAINSTLNVDEDRIGASMGCTYFGSNSVTARRVREYQDRLQGRGEGLIGGEVVGSGRTTPGATGVERALKIGGGTPHDSGREGRGSCTCAALLRSKIGVSTNVLQEEFWFLPPR